ncbi:YaiI/YqxD family protein [Bdellovibrio sp. SKB1291214]|uniref:YaiI/YqxD family protein n=1 Tax=Bdellovibrio sp. SKB1291214 TaxID=1732569 RepID=UPI000B518D8F|nr:YaiI/YqxD family protein [Bdellovibrio sp. SKB1291214]UYL10390.1 YaiI/YqxD family protein [Bdellovibrio sp. SKB1291214]
MLDIYIDADGCPVKEETYKVAERYQLKVFVVANKYLNVPQDLRVQMIVASSDFDAADDWIVEHTQKGDIVITADILLAERCVKKQVRAIGTKGIEFTEDSIGSAVATRELMQNLRHMGEVRGGPAPMDKKDRSKFLSTLDQVIQQLKRC